MRERSFASVVRRKVMLALAPAAALVGVSSTAVALTTRGYAALGATISLGASWIAIGYWRKIQRKGRRAGDYVLGWQSERIVQEELAPLKQRYYVNHDVTGGFGGNIDHVVCGPTGAFAIDTKTTARYVRVHYVSARRRAKWLSTRLEGRWVTPVICLVNSNRKPYQDERVWIVSASDLREWLEAQRGRPVDPVFALRAL
jgi:hypothetical protein